MREQLRTVPLLSFLDAYPEPAFILCSNSAPQANLVFLYGNLALHSLILGEDEYAVLDDSTFFNVLYEERTFEWLANPARPGPNTSGATRTLNFRPAWLPRDHAPLKLEVTATLIELPLTIPAVHSASRSFVYIASTRKAAPQLLRAAPVDDARRQPQSNRASQKSLALESFMPSRSTASHTSTSLIPSDPTKLPSRMVDTFPWEQTPLGPQSDWPQSLKTMVRYIMAKPIPTTIYWGWPELIMIYNDSYARLAGTKHPSIFGQRAGIAWGDMWDTVSPVAELCWEGKSTSKADDSLFFTSLTEFGLPQEVYHTWHWCPVWKEDGSVGGALNSSIETTQRIVAERRFACVSGLMQDLSKTTNQESVVQTVLDSLSQYETDLPFIALYSCSLSEPESGPLTRLIQATSDSTAAKRMFSKSQLKVTLTRVGAVGIPEHHPAAPETIKYSLNPSTFTEHLDIGPLNPIIEDDPDATPRPFSPAASPSRVIWPFPSVFASGQIEIVNPIPEVLVEGLNSRAFGDTPNIGALVPIRKHQSNPGPNLPHIVLVVGLNTRRPYDADCHKWLQAIASAFSSRLLAVEKIESDSEAMEERIRLDKAKSNFFMTVSHELRTPLTLIQAPIEQIAELKDLPDTVARRTKLAVRNVKRLRKLVDSILDMSKLEAGQLTGRFQPVQLDRLTADMASLFQSMAEKKGVKLQLEVENQKGAIPPTYVDIVLWEKIFCNLLSNAFKYTSKGKVTVSVTYDYTSACLRVIDTGIGIPQSKQQEVFEHFQRLHDLPAEGTGIGLALAKELVNLHGGRLTVASRAETEFTSDTGSIFTVTIPLGANHLPPGHILETPAPALKTGRELDIEEFEYWMELEAATSSANSDDEIMSASSTLFFEPTDVVLLVDDNKDMRSFMRSIFAPYLTILEAANGIEALEISANHKVDLILSDVLMPRMGGMDLLSKLRENQKTMLIPLVFVTAVADDVGLFDGREEGIADCITKPFRARDLLARAHLQLQLGKRRIALENNFEERTRELQTLTDLCPVGIFRTDLNGEMIYANSTWHQITGHPKEQDKDEWLEWASPNSHTEALKAWRRCFLDKESSSVRLKWKNNRWTQFNIAPLLAPQGLILGAFGTITDVTDLYNLEEAKVTLAGEREQSAAMRAEDAELRRQAEEERRRAQELLIDVTSHELRQPVSAILQNAEVVHANMLALRDHLAKCRADHTTYSPTEKIVEELDEDLQAMESIMQCGLSQARIASDVLSLSRLQLDALSIHPTTFDIKHQVQRILSVFKNELASKEIILSIKFGDRVEWPGLSVISTDRDRFTQIITNLMSNAIRFTEMSVDVREIKIALDIALDPPSDESCAPPTTHIQVVPSSAQEEGSVYVYVSIQDSGPGLQKEDLALLFQRFQQGSNAHHVFGGSGLGLFVCRQLCALMGGRIEVENVSVDQDAAVRSGAKFQFFIRVAKASAPVPQAVAPISAPKPRRPHVTTTPSLPARRLTPSKSLHVLITEDNKINQASPLGIMMRQMKRAGFTTVLASHGAEAVDVILEGSRAPSSSPFDVVLMDLEMPVMDGFSATREIRRLEEAGEVKSHNFIIAVTGNARSEQVQAARDAGVDAVIIKPYDSEKLIATMLTGAQSSG